MYRQMKNISITSTCPVHGIVFLCRDLSLNPIVNISDTTFQGFISLNYM